MKKTIAIIVLSIVAAIGFFFAIIMTADSTDNYGKMYDAQSTNTALQNTATAFANDKNVYEAQLVVTLESVETDNSTLQDQLNATECANQPKYIDYTSNATVSDSLKIWVQDNTGESVTNATYQTVWSNSKTAIHKVFGKYMYPYLVFFNEPKLNHTYEIYDITNSCWLYQVDLP